MTLTDEQLDALAGRLHGTYCASGNAFTTDIFRDIAREAARWADEQPANPQAAQVQEGLTPRHWRLIRFALWRLCMDAYDRANAAAQDKGRRFKPGAAEAFLRDAKDAEVARAIVATAIIKNGWGDDQNKGGEHG